MRHRFRGIFLLSIFCTSIYGVELGNGYLHELSASRQTNCINCPINMVYQENIHEISIKKLEAKIALLIQRNAVLVTQVEGLLKMKTPPREFSGVLTVVEDLASYMHQVTSGSNAKALFSAEQAKVVGLLELFHKSREYYAKHSKQAHDKAIFCETKLAEMEAEKVSLLKDFDLAFNKVKFKNKTLRDKNADLKKSNFLLQNELEKLNETLGSK